MFYLLLICLNFEPSVVFGGVVLPLAITDDAMTSAGLDCCSTVSQHKCM